MMTSKCTWQPVELPVVPARRSIHPVQPAGHLGNQLRIMAVAGLDIASVINSHAHARVACPCKHGHRSSFRSVDRRAAGNWVVLADVNLVARASSGWSASHKGWEILRGSYRVHQLEIARQLAQLSDQRPRAKRWIDCPRWLTRTPHQHRQSCRQGRPSMASSLPEPPNAFSGASALTYTGNR